MASFERIGAAEPESPVVISVPHAGRDYPLSLRAALRVPATAAMALEDRHVDAVALAARSNETMFVQQLARAWIDLNRGEHERDPRVDDGASPHSFPQASEKLRSGLGLIPRRATRAGDLWRRRFSAEEVAARIEAAHRPYHAALADALGRARARFGVAVLLDLHSMPPLSGTSPAQVVIGDRFGRSASARFVSRIEAEADCVVAVNSPYAGGHILESHGNPGRGIHAVQLELDRALYLDGLLDRPGNGFAATVALLRRIIAALTDEAMSAPLAIAAE